MNLSLLKNIGIINTFRLNHHYFGWCGAIRPLIIASRNLKIKKLSGEVKVNSNKIGAVKIGFGNVGIIDNKYRRTLWENNDTIIFRGKVSLCAGTKISCSGKLSFGDRCHFNGNSDIVCFNSIEFGNECLVSWECLFMDTDFHALYDSDSNTQINMNKPIFVGNHVWIGCRTTILKGSTIPDGSVIAACSVITKKLKESNCVYASNDVLKRNISW